MNKEKSRIKNAKKNVKTSVIVQIAILLFSFLVRTVFIRKLNSTYLGLNGLFTNILSILSIADLGFDTAILYSMYKPIAVGDEKKIASLMQYFRKIYMVIGSVVLAIGLCFLPFLGAIINTDIPMVEVYKFYILYLLNTVLSYFLANRVAIINADQKSYIIKRYTAAFKITMFVLQIASLYIFKSFTVYLLIQLICTLAMNIYGAYKANRLYPFIKTKATAVSKEEKKELFKNVRSMLIYKIGGVILSNTDNILISTIISVQMVGIYDNYSTIVAAVTSMTSIVFGSLAASVGNLNATSSSEKKEEVLKRIELLSTITYGFCSVCLIMLSNDFIRIIWGHDYVSNMYVLIAAVINFELVGLLYPIRLFRETSGLFKEIKYIFIWTSAINLILSVILGNLLKPYGLGLFGIIIATAISRCLTTFWFEPVKLYQTVLFKSPAGYFKRRSMDIIKLVAIIALNYLIFMHWEAGSISAFFAKAASVAALNGVLFIVLYRRREEFKYLLSLSKR